MTNSLISAARRGALRTVGAVAAAKTTSSSSARQKMPANTESFRNIERILTFVLRQKIFNC